MLRTAFFDPQLLKKLQLKHAFVDPATVQSMGTGMPSDPASLAGMGAPMDPSMMGGGGMPPMDPAMMGGGGMPPMDPAMMGGGGMPPMDPSMMGAAAPPAPDTSQLEQRLASLEASLGQQAGSGEADKGGKKKIDVGSELTNLRNSQLRTEKMIALLMDAMGISVPAGVVTEIGQAGAADSPPAAQAQAPASPPTGQAGTPYAPISSIEPMESGQPTEKMSVVQPVGVHYDPEEIPLEQRFTAMSKRAGIIYQAMLKVRNGKIT